MCSNASLGSCLRLWLLAANLRVLCLSPSSPAQNWGTTTPPNCCDTVLAPNCQLSTTTRSASRPACSRCALYCFLIRPHHVQSAPMTLVSSVPCPVRSNVTQRERSNGNIQRLISTRPSTSWRCWFCGDVRAPLSNQNISAVRSTYSDTLPAGSVCYVLSHSTICLLFRRDAQKGLLLI